MDKSDVTFEEHYIDVLRFLRGLSRDEYLAEELTQETFSIHTAKSRHMLPAAKPVKIMNRKICIGF